MVNIYSEINALCTQNNVTITEMCKELDITRSSLSELRSGRTKRLSHNAMMKISSHFNVDMDFFEYETNDCECLECGATYSDVNDTIHLQFHNRWKAAVKKFGFCWTPRYRNNVKWRAIGKLEDNKKSPDKKLSDADCANLQEQIFKGYFSRSLFANIMNKNADEHITYEKYCAALLNQEHFKGIIDVPVYDLLINKFGTNDLIPDGTYYSKECIQTKKNSAISNFKSKTLDTEPPATMRQLKYALYGNPEESDELLDEIMKMAQIQKQLRNKTDK